MRNFFIITFSATVLIPAAAGGVVIWAEGNTTKIAPDAPPPASTYVWDGERVAVKAARGEWESFQLVIRSDQPRLISFEIYDLEGLRGKVVGSTVSAYREVYVPVTTPSAEAATGFVLGAAGRWPDPLVPVRGHVDAAGGENTVLWLDVYVPPDAFAGKYTGEIKLKWSGGALTVPVDLTVWDFPLAPRSRYVLLTTVDAGAICRRHGVKPDDEAARPLVAKYAALLAEHRVWPVNLAQDYALARPAAGPLAAGAPNLFSGSVYDRGLAKAAEGVAAPLWETTFEEGDAYHKRVAELRAKGVHVVYDAAGLADDLDLPAADHRLVGWACWRFGGEFARLAEATFAPGGETRLFTDDPWNEYGNGGRTLVYDGAEAGAGGPVPSIRLKLAREAAEDYEYLAMLADAGLAPYADELAAAVVPASRRAEAPAPDVFYRAREAAAVALVKVNWKQGVAGNTVGGRAIDDANEPVAGAVVAAGLLAAVTDAEGRYELQYAPRGAGLTATAPGYEKAGAAGDKGDFFMRRHLRRYLLNDAKPGGAFVAKGLDRAGAVKDLNPAKGYALRGWLKKGRAGSFVITPALRDWRTFAALGAELYNGGAAGIKATLRLEDAQGRYYEEIFLLAPGAWRTARAAAADVGERYLVGESGGAGGPKLDLSSVSSVVVSFEGAGGVEVRLGRVWLEAENN